MDIARWFQLCRTTGHSWGSTEVPWGELQGCHSPQPGEPRQHTETSLLRLLKSTQGRSNNSKISKCIREHKLSSELSTCTQRLLIKSCSSMKVSPRVDRCYQHVYPTWFSDSEGFFASLLFFFFFFPSIMRVLRRQPSTWSSKRKELEVQGKEE